MNKWVRCKYLKGSPNGEPCEYDNGSGMGLLDQLKVYYQLPQILQREV
jgi:hypothetical protein